MGEQRERAAQEDPLLASAIPIDHSEVEAADDEQPADLGEALTGPGAAPAEKPKIQALGQRVPHEDHWKRQPNVTGKGAIHVRTFVAKLRPEAIDHLDRQINEWLDAHPEYEVKFVTTSVGTLTSKSQEDALFMNVWV